MCLWICLCIPLSSPHNNSVKTFMWQRRTVGGVFFSAAHVISKESRQLVLPRTPCLDICRSFAVKYCHLLGYCKNCRLRGKPAAVVLGMGCENIKLHQCQMWNENITFLQVSACINSCQTSFLRIQLVVMLSIGIQQNLSPTISIQSMGKTKKVLSKMKALSVALFE
jgi:hypothetical protein